jgi:C4-dicarboxylate transporter DctQ subunit
MMKYLDRLEEIIITFLIGAATLVIFVAVLHRYTAGMPIPGLQDKLLAINLSWAQELCIYMFVWMAKFGAAYGVRTGIHVGVDVLVTRLPEPWRVKCVVIGIAGGALFTGLIGTLGAHFVWENGMHYAVYKKLGMDISLLTEGPITPDLEWPTWVIYSAVPLGSYLMCFRFLQVGWNFLRTGVLPHHDHGHVEGIEEEPADDTGALETYEEHKYNHEKTGGGAG